MPQQSIHPPDFVQRHGNRIVVQGKLNPYTASGILGCVNEAKEKGYEDCILDFSLCNLAFPNGLVPVAALVDKWRSEGMEFEVVLPVSDTASKLMVNCNFGHFLQPDTYQYTRVLLPKHISIRRYETLEEQVGIVKEFVSVALNAMTLPRDILQGMEWSLNEVMDNVLIHAEAQRGGFAQATTLEDRVAFTVADCGRGVLTSLREGYPALRKDTDAIGEAIKAGVTRNPEVGQGNGLAGTLRVATLSGGSFTILSGQGVLTVFSKDTTIESRGRHVPRSQSFPGTIISAQILRSATFKMSEALRFTNMIGGVFDVIEANYETEDGRAFLVSMRGEAPGFGNREAGKQIRTKIGNLLNADKSKPVLVDWEGVPLISSSFADEAFGKLFVELGPLEFGARIRNVKMENLVRGLINNAILQRTAQVMNLAARASTELPPVGFTEAPMSPEADQS